ncbi:DUF935 domain-containing protein [Pseudoroseicyclus sp. H15]
MARTPQLLDHLGRPVKRAVLSEEISAARVGSARSPIAGTPANGLDPVRLASILRAADQGDPLQYLELAEVIEERDPHYLGVLGTRKRSVSQIEITVEAASDASHDVMLADMVRDWLKRDELTLELFDVLDAIGKGFSFTEIIWEVSEGQWRPQRLEFRDPRWFRFSRDDLVTPVMIGDDGQEQDLQPWKFIVPRIQAKSGLPLRSGLARVASWGWMFKAYTQRDWAIFTQTYGQPVRVGKFGPGASESDKDTLFNAVANIAGDCAAIIPESMAIDFVEASNVGSSTALYKERADWLDQQISKAVLGQTATTDAIAGGHAVGQEHRQVQEDIERADAKALAAALNRDLVIPWVQLEHGPQKRYPRIVIARPEAEDLDLLTRSVARLVPLGFRVSASDLRDKLGLPDPGEKDDLLHPAVRRTTPPAVPVKPTSPIKRFSGPIKQQVGSEGTPGALQAEGASAGLTAPLSPVASQADQLAVEARPAMEMMLAQIEAMVAKATDFDELMAMVNAGFGTIDNSDLAEVLGRAMMAASVAGRVAVDEEGQDA